VITIGDREEILQLWIQTESKMVGYPLVEGIHFEVERLPDRILVYYYKDDETLEITDTPVLH